MDLRVSSYAVIHDERGMLLSHWREPAYGGWTLPGGGILPGEHPEQAVVREVAEEAGYRVRVDSLLGVLSHVIPGELRIPGPAPTIHLIRLIYRCTVLGGDLQVEVDGTTDDVAWFSLDELSGLQHVDFVDEAVQLAGLRPSRS